MIYVTGITGHSGRWFLKRLVQERFSETLRLVMRKPREEAPEQYETIEQIIGTATNANTQQDKGNESTKIEFAVGDLKDENFLRESLKGVDTLIHIASIGFSKSIMKARLVEAWG